MDALSSIPCPVEGFQAQTLEGEVVLLHLGRNIVLHLNPTSALIWSLCDGRRSVGEIVALLGAAYPEAQQEIAADAPRIVQELAAYHALTLT